MPKKNSSHKKYPRASSFYALSNCNASFLLSQRSGEEPPTTFSDRGSTGHGIISGRIAPEGVEEGLLEEARYLQLLDRNALDEWTLRDFPFTEVTEKRLWCRKGPIPYYSGQPDKYVVQRERVYLCDYKTGWHPLDDYVATNCQIRAYVALISIEQGETQIDEITAHIHKPGRRSPPAVFDAGAIAEARDWALNVAMTALAKAGKEPNRGPWCKFCSGKVLCPLWKEEVTTLSEFHTAIISDIPDSVLREIAPKLYLAQTVVEKLLERLYERVKAKPTFFADWHLAPASPRRKVTDVIEAYNALVVKEAVLSPGEFLITCRVAVGELEKRVRKARALSVRDAQALMDKILDGIMEYNSPRDTLLYDPKPENALPE